MLEICSVNRRVKAERPVTPVSVRTRSSGSLSWCGQVAALVAQVVRAEGERGVGEQALGLLVGHLVPLQLEEQQLGLDRRAELARLLQQRAGLGRLGVDREREHRVRAGASGGVGDRLQLAHRGGEAGGVELGDLAAVGGGERLGALASEAEQLGHPGAALAVDERLEVPVGGFESEIGHRRDDNGAAARPGRSGPRRRRSLSRRPRGGTSGWRASRRCCASRHARR